MDKNTPILNIKDLALLKSKPSEYYQRKLKTTKTHDGTSSGPINVHIKDFITEYKNTPFRVVAVYDKDGNLIKKETEGIENDIKQEVPVYSKKDLENMGTNNNIIYKPTLMGDGSHMSVQLPYDNPEKRWSEPDKYLEVPNKDDLERLTYTNEDGEQLVRSITMISRYNGEGSNTDPSVTIIKNNKYSSEDNEKLMGAGQKLNDVVGEYDNKKWDIEQQVRDDWEKENGIENGRFVDENGRTFSAYLHPTFNEMRMKQHETVQKELPDIYTYIEQSGVYDDFENANAKLKIRKNPKIEAKYDNYKEEYQTDYYEDVWSEVHNELYSDPY